MRAAPALNLTVVRDGTWRPIVAMCAAASGAALIAWIAQQLALSPLVTAASAVAAGAVAFFIAWRASRLGPLGLRFDGARWHVYTAGSMNLGELPGQLVVVLDLGSWLLLRFEPEDLASPSRPPRWLPLARGRLPAHWHALRCAVFSPRPGLDSGAPADPQA